MTFWTVGSEIPSEVSKDVTCCCVAAFSSPVVMRVPEVKSIPRFKPLPPIASAPISRITPDIEKKYLDAPMKSNFHVRFSPPAPSIDGLEIVRELPITLRIACVAMTAVNSETNVPIPSVNAKPWTSEVASTNRMNAVMIVTTFASMIAVRPFL